ADLDVASVLRRRLHDPRGRKLAGDLTPGEASRNVCLQHGEMHVPTERVTAPMCEPLDDVAEVYAALKLALSDYVRKTGFEKVVVAMSGGIDSSLVASIAADALGSENVIGVSMPSRFSSEGSRTDARELADNLGIQLYTIPIEEPFSAFLDILAERFEGTKPGLAEENLQARCRANVVMALSNKFNWLVVTTGNKSEMAVGYSTLYGDLAGGYALIKDVPKMLVYELCRYRNTLGKAVPENVFMKAPSAELRPDQKDEDNLPPYAILDPILDHYVEGDHSVDEIAAMGFDRDVVAKVVNLVDRSEYKRRQAPPGPKVTPRAFGRDRRLPIVNRYSHD
ncbi:MAG: NAD(+) synthase, partial [Chloroflexota bacterium]|nr:NAD(+) synthase [Chloroflexota bacterium]